MPSGRVVVAERLWLLHVVAEPLNLGAMLGQVSDEAVALQRPADRASWRGLHSEGMHEPPSLAVCLRSADAAARFDMLLLSIGVCAARHRDSELLACVRS
jgi:hypothetical protein